MISSIPPFTLIFPFNSSLCDPNLSFPIDTMDTNPNPYSGGIHQRDSDSFPKTRKRMSSHECEV